jgi:hypothetical protein
MKEKREMTEQEIKDAIESKSTMIGGLLYVIQFHTSVVATSQGSVEALRKEIGELTKFLQKVPTLENEEKKLSEKHVRDETVEENKA